MSETTLVSRFTPSLLPPEALEATFVKRHRLADRLLEKLRASITSDAKHRMLLVGPRGIGKTHLVALLYHRLRSLEALGSSRVLAWLREEEWGVTSFLDLLMAILRAIEEEEPKAERRDAFASLMRLTPEVAEGEASKLLLEWLERRTLVLFCENLDEIFRGLGRVGQERLRAFLQNHPVVTIVATSQSLFRGVSKREQPFYGFFDVHPLEPLGFEDALSLLRRIALSRGDRPLAEALGSVRGRARLRVVHHLAAGNPRIYVIFAQFLFLESLSELVEVVLRTLDDLTPYYQSRMGALSPQQRKIVAHLCDHRGAIPVAQIAEANFLTPQTTSGQLRKLAELGYVGSEKVGREVFYELREPLMRLALQVKKLRGQPVRLLVEFLRYWFSQDELRQRISTLERGKLDTSFLIEALQLGFESAASEPVVVFLNDFKRHWQAYDFEKACEVAEELVELRGSLDDYLRLLDCAVKLGRWEEALDACQAVLESDPKSYKALLEQVQVLRNLGDLEGALVKSDQLLDDYEDKASFWLFRARVLEDLGQSEDASLAYERTVSIAATEGWEWMNRARAFQALGRYSESAEAYRQAQRLDPENLFIHEGAAYVFEAIGEYGSAASALSECLRLLGRSDLPLLYQHGAVLNSLGQYEAALGSLERGLKLDPTDLDAGHLRAIVLYRLGRCEESLNALSACIELAAEDDTLGRAALVSNRAIALSSLGRLEEAKASLEESLVLDPESDFHRLSNLASIRMALGEWEEGIAGLDEALRRWVAIDTSTKELGGEVAIVRNLLIRTQDPASWRPFIETWVEVFEGHDLLPLLGQGVARSIRTLGIPGLTVPIRKAWNATWQKLGGSKLDLEVPLRFLDTATGYLENHDPRVLLTLAKEERSLLRSILPVDENAS